MVEIEKMVQAKGLNAPRLRPEDIDAVIESAEYIMMPSGRTMVCEMTLKNGFTVRGETTCADPRNFDEEIGRKNSYDNARDQIWMFEGYLLKQRLYKIQCFDEGTDLTFGDVLVCMEFGGKLARRGWNGNGIFIERQNPDENSKMSSPYIFIDTTGLKSDNPDAPRKRTPWAPSQTDLLAVDWYVVK